MNSLFLNQYLEMTKKIICNDDFRKKYVQNPEKDFIRNRKIGFDGTIKYILGNSRESMAFTSEKFADASVIGNVTPAAICKARAKISYGAIEEVFEECAKAIPASKNYNNYRLIAFDGMKGEMPNLPSLRTLYPVNSKQGYPMFHALAARDILNNIFLCADFQPAPADERQMASRMLDKLSASKEKIIYLMDRGFPCVALIQKLNNMGQKYVMRVSGKFLTEVSDFAKSDKTDELLTITYGERRGANCKTKAELPYTFSLRCVRIKLDSGEDEICITNLLKEDFTVEQIKELYNYRWGIETSYDYLKNSIFVEEFTSKRENGIKQDFYASLWAANLTSIAITDSVQEPVKKGLYLIK